MDVVAALAEEAAALLGTRDRVLVGLDGPDAAGKTTMATALSSALRQVHGTHTVSASVDDFMPPKEQRYLRGELSPEGYYLDGFDHAALVRDLLAPFHDGAPQVRTSLGGPAVEVPARAVLVVDGVFLLRPELRPWWTLSAYLHVRPEVALERALTRDLPVHGSTENVVRRYLARYLPGQALYRERADPMSAAAVLLDTEDPAHPVVLRWGREGGRAPTPERSSPPDRRPRSGP